MISRLSKNAKRPPADTSRRAKSATSRREAAARWRDSRSRRWLAWFAVAVAVLTLLSPATAQNTADRPGPQSLDFSSAAPISGAPNTPLKLELPGGLSGGPEQWTSPQGLSSTIQVMLLLTVLSLAPAILLMTTSFIRIVVVLGLLRQAIGTQ